MKRTRKVRADDNKKFLNPRKLNILHDNRRRSTISLWREDVVKVGETMAVASRECHVERCVIEVSNHITQGK